VTQVQAQQPAVGPTPEELELLARLRDGDERAFEELVKRHYTAMLGVARTYVKTRAIAEEVVQDAWIGVLKGLDRFEGRSTLKTWIMRIVVNTARTRGVREARSIAFSSLVPEGEEAAVDPARFRGLDDGFPGHWNGYPTDWRSLPEEALLGRETREVVLRAIEELPDAQRLVITMRDIEGWSGPEACVALDVSEANQRVLLHRARSRVRDALGSGADLAAPHGDCDRVRPSLRVELRHRVAYVRTHRLRRKVEPLRHLFAAPAAGEQIEDLALALREQRRALGRAPDE
jgi:RNA polymerase sigma-70 factor (ECF subfamily)